MKHKSTVCVMILTLAGVAGCSRNQSPDRLTWQNNQTAPSSAARSHNFDPCALVLAPHSGAGRVDKEIIRWQREASEAGDPSPAIERLGWTFVAKARESFDPAFYRVAEHCALCLESRRPGSPEALLLRGHALHNLHQFKEAEPLARELVARRGLPFDFGLLGDVLMEQGRLEEATDAYQKMIDLKPDLHSYARGAHMRWLKGDVAGALELMQMAAGAASPLEPEPAAWVYSRLASHYLQTGSFSEARVASQASLEFQKDYPPALLARGRTLLAEGNVAEAIESLESATRLNPLPEYQWALSEALREGDRTAEAEAVESQLKRTGSTADPRTYALYLATQAESAQSAVQLAREELRQRGDIFTHDAMAWSLAAAGQFEEARRHMKHALAEGTQDARLFYHAAVIAAKAGYDDEAHDWFDKATDLIHLLLPSEQRQLATALAEREESVGTDDAAPSETLTSAFSTRKN